jgi:4-amino-4-deoxy-L-arabinose transferase-like glycosyltransferase
MIKKKYISSLFVLFLVSHLILWTLVPTFSNLNLPLDTIEALAWGSNLAWGFEKHPPFSAFAVEFFYKIFGSQDWAYYFLSQLFVVISFFIVWKFSEDFFKEKIYALFSVLLLEGIYFYNYTTPEFNVNVCQLPFWAGTVYFCWKSINTNSFKNWVLFGFFAGLGFLSKYLFIYLLFALAIFIIRKMIKEKKFNPYILVSLSIFFLIITPHLLWLIQNNFLTVFYGLNRTGLENANFLEHLTNPLLFLGKQAGILIPTLLMLFIIVSKFKVKINIKDKKFQYLIFATLIPLLLLFLTSLLTGANIRTMWATPFYLFIGVFFLYLFKERIKLKNTKKFLTLFLFLFLLSPTIYLSVSILQKDKRTDYPGNEIAYLVQSKWNKNFSNEISVIVGDEWFGGNLSYHLKSRPRWFNQLNEDITTMNIQGGFIYAGNPKVLKKICPGVFGVIKPVGVCMIGVK